MTILLRTDICSILEYIESQPKENQAALFVEYCNQVNILKDIVKFYFTDVKGKFKHKELGDVNYQMPENEFLPAYSSIERNFKRIQTMVAPATTVEQRRSLKFSIFSGLSVPEILLLENYLDGQLETLYKGIKWSAIKKELKVA